MTDAVKAPRRYKRRRSGSAEWHMSRKAVSVSVPRLLSWTDTQCLNFLVEARFGSWKTVRCPHCGTVGKHYWRALEHRWKCAGCHSTFSITSGTHFARRKVTPQNLLSGVLLFVNSAGGQPALELKRHIDVTYNSAFTLQHKVREGFMRGFNVGLVSGDIEMDGAHQSGRRAAEKRGRPQVTQPVDENTPEAELTAAMLTQRGQQKRRKGKPKGALDPEFGRRLPEDRRILITVRKRSGRNGKGACATRVAVGLVETAPVAESIMTEFVAIPESSLNTDTSPAYTVLGRGFRGHLTVEHSKELRGPNGENNNQAEEFNWRQQRAEQGVYLNIEPKYLLDYAAEMAFRSDTRRLPNGAQLKLAMSVTMSVGESLFWKGFTRGHHRGIEFLHPQPQPARSSGPAKGRHPFSIASARPPR